MHSGLAVQQHKGYPLRSATCAISAQCVLLDSSNVLVSIVVKALALFVKLATSNDRKPQGLQHHIAFGIPEFCDVIR